MKLSELGIRLDPEVATKLSGGQWGWVNGSVRRMRNTKDRRRGHGGMLGRIVWEMAHGVRPPGIVRHVNGDSRDYRVKNLRVDGFVDPIAVIRLRAEGLRKSQIAERVGCSLHAVTVCLDRIGIDSRDPMGPKPRE